MLYKIEQKLKQRNKQKFGSVNFPQQKLGKDDPNLQNKGQSKGSQTHDN